MTPYQIERGVTRFAIVKTRGHESLLATEVTKYIQMSSSHLSTLSSIWEEPFSSVKSVLMFSGSYNTPLVFLSLPKDPLWVDR